MRYARKVGRYGTIGEPSFFNEQPAYVDAWGNPIAVPAQPDQEGGGSAAQEYNDFNSTYFQLSEFGATPQRGSTEYLAIEQSRKDAAIVGATPLPMYPITTTPAYAQNPNAVVFVTQEQLRPAEPVTVDVDVLIPATNPAPSPGPTMSANPVRPTPTVNDELPSRPAPPAAPLLPFEPALPPAPAPAPPPVSPMPNLTPTIIGGNTGPYYTVSTPGSGTVYVPGTGTPAPVQAGASSGSGNGALWLLAALALLGQ